MAETNDGRLRPRGNVGGAEVKLSQGAVRSELGGGWTASEVLRPGVGMTEEAKEAGGVSIGQAVREDREERGAVTPRHSPEAPLTALGQPFAMFRHPSEFTEAEDEVIVQGLMAQLPLYMIAAKLNCSRNLLVKHIQESKLLTQVQIDRDESYVDRAEWQALKLIEAGNPAMVMFALQTRGKKRGWGQQEIGEVDMDDSRIVIGEIPAEEVAEAERLVKESEREASEPPGGEGQGAEGGDASREKAAPPAKTPASGATGGVRIPSPLEMAVMGDVARAAAEEVQRERDARTVDIPKEDVRVEPAPWDDGFSGGDPFGGMDAGGFDGFM